MTKKILIVDDDQLMQKLLEYIIKKAGYKVSVADNGSNALKIVKRDKPNLIISDVEMPKMNGLELCQKLKENFDTKLIPIILITSNTQIQDKLSGFRSGADDYFMKPLHLKNLLTRVQSLLENGDALSSETDVD
ncbi:hypothetical protein LCGC14_1169260 [marine sediment metagenome]|uniref:Response regulatory domain-containing protein n=1 Tax=marine sediment metagenome TaxID=412755 RepID=A0A0F9PVV9_9ZZZZ|nr:response regulator [Candidatus Aminicenantes bacterium]HEB34766.1 response regulator [Candidatus Aminicenantes bacterium]